MHPTVQRFLELERKKDEYKKYLEEFNKALEDVISEYGVGGTFQDDEGTVYKTTAPDGKFVYFDKFGYVRTKRTGEARGTLSVKEAEEAGYKVK